MFVSKLNELCQKLNFEAPKYTIISRNGPPHNPRFVISCSFSNITVKSESLPTRRKAKENAAKTAFLKYNNLISYSSDYEISDTTEDSDCSSYSESSQETKTKKEVYVCIDYDNVHEITDWILENRKNWNIKLFVTQNTIVNYDNITIFRSYTNLPNATDLQMVIFTTRFANCMRREDKLVIVSRDKIFETFQAELSNDSVLLCKTIEELKKI